MSRVNNRHRTKDKTMKLDNLGIVMMIVLKMILNIMLMMISMWRQRMEN